jgi:hypothetical protein
MNGDSAMGLYVVPDCGQSTVASPACVLFDSLRLDPRADPFGAA